MSARLAAAKGEAHKLTDQYRKVGHHFVKARWSFIRALMPRYRLVKRPASGAAKVEQWCFELFALSQINKSKALTCCCCSNVVMFLEISSNF